MGAASKRARKVRTSAEFDLVRLAPELRPPKVASGAYAWSLEDIRNARDAQMAGKFRQASRLAEAMRTDAGLFVAWMNRLAPQRGLPVELRPANDTARAVRIRDEGDALFGPKGIGVTHDTLADVNSALANHSVAFAYNVVTPRPDGSRVDFEMKYWPIEWVQWVPSERCFKTQVEGGRGLEPITHGDGRWIIFQKHEWEPWKTEAAVLPGGLVWAGRAYGSRDWSKGSSGHGNAKVVGTMPEGLSLLDETGNMTPEGAAFAQLLRDVASLDTPYGIKPFGAALDYITNNSQAWQVWKELILAKDSEASKIYLGQDGTVNNSGGNYIKSDVLFNVRNDIVEGDLGAIERGLLTGLLEPWTAVNFGDSTLAPQRVYLMPDFDEMARKTAEAEQGKAYAERTTAFYNALKAARDVGVDLTPDFVTSLAKDFGVRAPTLKAATPTLPVA